MQADVKRTNTSKRRFLAVGSAAVVFASLRAAIARPVFDPHVWLREMSEIGFGIQWSAEGGFYPVRYYNTPVSREHVAKLSELCAWISEAPDNIEKTFDFEDIGVRSLLRDDEPWFVAADVCRALALANSRDAVSRLDTDEISDVGIADTRSKGGATQQRNMTIISEPGVYRLVFTSRTEAAERFKRWLAHEVLPSLRRTGSYSLRDEDGDILPSLAHGRLWGQPVAKINAAARMISAAHRLYGPEAARHLWTREKGLPKLEKFSVIATTGNACDDFAGCWKHLMRAVVGANRTLGSLLDLSLHDRLAAHKLKDYGLILNPVSQKGMLAIANSNPFLASVFASTQWADDWRLAMAQLPGAHPYKGKLLQSIAAAIATTAPSGSAAGATLHQLCGLLSSGAKIAIETASIGSPLLGCFK
eukprot:gene19538-19973_t